MENPPIDIFGLTILEPITSLTAVLVSIVCLYAFFQLSKLPRHDRVHHFFRYYFLSMAVATAVGGIIGHAFLYAFTFAWNKKINDTSMFQFEYLTPDEKLITGASSDVDDDLIQFRYKVWF